MGRKQRKRGLGQEPEAYVTVAEVARRLAVSDRSVRDWIIAGRLPAYRIGVLVRLRWSEVEAAIIAPIRAAC